MSSNFHSFHAPFKLLLLLLSLHISLNASGGLLGGISNVKYYNSGAPIDMFEVTFWGNSVQGITFSTTPQNTYTPQVYEDNDKYTVSYLQNYNYLYTFKFYKDPDGMLKTRSMVYKYYFNGNCLQTTTYYPQKSGSTKKNGKSSSGGYYAPPANNGSNSGSGSSGYSTCRICGGSKTCTSCHGNGGEWRETGYYTGSGSKSWIACPSCNGSKKCFNCRGTGRQ